jgi:hypothetical protein
MFVHCVATGGGKEDTAYIAAKNRSKCRLWSGKENNGMCVHMCTHNCDEHVSLHTQQLCSTAVQEPKRTPGATC